jgi:hypothetical protein
MVVQPRFPSPRPQVLFAKWVAARRATSSQVEGALTEAQAEAHAVEAWKSIDQLS